MQVRLSGEGDAGSEGGGSGNLYVAVNVQEHNFFQRDGTDIIYTLPLNVAEAALGADKVIPNIDGLEAEFKVPQRTQHGTVFNIRGKGVPHLNSNRRGNMRIMADVRVPGSLSREQRELLEELARSFNGEKPAQKRSTNGRKRSGKKDNPETRSESADENSTEKGLFDRIKDDL